MADERKLVRQSKLLIAQIPNSADGNMQSPHVTAASPQTRGRPSRSKTQVSKSKAVPILPRQVAPAVPRAIPLAPRPSLQSRDGLVADGGHSPYTAESRKTELKMQSESKDFEDGNAIVEKRRSPRTRTFTEDDDNVLIAFWRENYELYTKSSKLAFARKAVEHLNKVFAISPIDTTPTHEKQVHNKICYMVRRYEGVLQKHESLRGISDLSQAGHLAAQAKAEFPHFPKMHAFMSKCPSSTPKRKGTSPPTSPTQVSNEDVEGHVRDIQQADVTRVNGDVQNGTHPPSKRQKHTTNGGECNGVEDRTVALTAVADRMGIEEIEGIRARIAEGNVSSLGQADEGDATLHERFLSLREAEIALRKEEILCKKQEIERRNRDAERMEEELELRKQEQLRLDAEFELKKKESEDRRQESMSRIRLEEVCQLRETAKVLFDLGLHGDATKCTDKIAELLKL